jgi:ParB family chromosome partitioning protein
VVVVVDNRKMEESKLEHIPIEKIEVLDNSRIRIEPSSLAPLMNNIKQTGLINPITLWKDPKKDRFILEAGNRRLQSCKLLGWNTIPSIVNYGTEFEFDKFLVKNLSENIYREDLTPLEIARVCGLLLEGGRTIGEISVITGISRGKITDSLNMIKKVPLKFKEHVKFTKSANENKKGFIPVKVANQILSNQYGRDNKDVEKLFELAKKNELSSQDISILKMLIAKKGFSVEEAMKKKEEIVSLIQENQEVNSEEDNSTVVDDETDTDNKFIFMKNLLGQKPLNLVMKMKIFLKQFHLFLKINMTNLLSRSQKMT